MKSHNINTSTSASEPTKSLTADQIGVPGLPQGYTPDFLADQHQLHGTNIYEANFARIALARYQALYKLKLQQYHDLVFAQKEGVYEITVRTNTRTIVCAAPGNTGYDAVAPLLEKLTAELSELADSISNTLQEIAKGFPEQDMIDYQDLLLTPIPLLPTSTSAVPTAPQHYPIPHTVESTLPRATAA